MEVARIVRMIDFLLQIRWGEIRPSSISKENDNGLNDVCQDGRRWKTVYVPYAKSAWAICMWWRIKFFTYNSVYVFVFITF